MRVANWHSKEIFRRIEERVEANGNAVMDEVVIRAKQKLLSGITGDPPVVRKPGWSDALVSFTPKTGRNKGELVTFQTSHRWTGRRTPDNLYDSIRRKTNSEKGNIRVYAGNYKVYWASMVEKGVSSTGWGKGVPARPFLRPAFNEVRGDIVDKVGKGLVL